MVLGAASCLELGGDDIVGASWGAQDMLVVTARHAVRVFKVSTQSCARSWVSRPGQDTEFTVACVRCHADGTMYSVQGQRSVVSWAWADETLGNASVHTLASPVVALRLSSSGMAAIAVCSDGSVHAFAQGKHLVSASPSGDLPPVVWAQVTKLQSGAGTGGDSVVLALHSNGSKSTGPTLSVWKVVTRRGALTSTATTLVRHVLPPAPSQPGDATVVAAVYHNVLQLLSVMWSTGDWQELHFADAGMLSEPRQRAGRRLLVGGAGAAVAPTPRRRKGKRSRRRGSSDAGSDSGAAAGPSFSAGQLGRTGVVVVGAVGETAAGGDGADTSGSDGAGVRVVAWDACYGAVLSSCTTELGAADPVVGAWSNSDGSHVAVATKRGVAVVQVVAGGSSLAAAVGSSAVTAQHVEPSTGGAVVSAVAPSVDVRSCLPAAAPASESPAARKKRRRRGGDNKGRTTAGAGAGAGAGAAVPVAAPLASDDLSVWADRVASAEEAEAAVVAKLVNPADTPTARAFTKVFDEYMAAQAPAAGTTNSRKRRRGRTAQAASAAVSHRFLTAVLGRIVSEPTLDLWAPLQQLLDLRRVSVGTCPGLLPFVMAQQRLDVLEECLRLLSDIPEEALAGVLRFVVARADAAAMTEFVASKFTSSHERARRGDEAVCAGIEHFVFLIMRTRVNDVLMQAALKQLSTSEATLLLAVVKRLLAAYWRHYMDVAPPRKADTEREDSKGAVISDSMLTVDSGTFHGATPASKVPSLNQVLEWTHMLVDSQFQALALRSTQQPRVRQLLKNVADLVSKHTQLAGDVAAAGLHGALSHMMDHGKAMPVRPTPDYSIETLRL